MRKPIRHGDVLLTPVDAIPASANKLPHRTVAEGEVTGHAHRLTIGDIYDSDGEWYVSAGDGDTITHEEHGPANLIGDYRIAIQREYDDENEWRQVAD